MQNLKSIFPWIFAGLFAVILAAESIARSWAESAAAAAQQETARIAEVQALESLINSAVVKVLVAGGIMTLFLLVVVGIAVTAYLRTRPRSRPSQVQPSAQIAPRVPQYNQFPNGVGEYLPYGFPPGYHPGYSQQQQRPPFVVYYPPQFQQEPQQPDEYTTWY